MKYVFLFLIAMAFVACKSQKDTSTSLRDTSSKTLVEGITFLDSTSAAKQIIHDQFDGFFEGITVVDMAIQLRTEKRFDDRSTALKSYKALLQSEVSDWDLVERQLMDSVMREVKGLIEVLNPKLWPNSIQLIKIKTNHYGPDVYYTREKAILIPQNAIERGDQEELITVMLHEIYHILSRYNKDFREGTYDLIHFKPHGKKVKYASSVFNRRLTNPDGVNMNYGITLQDDQGNQKLAFPILISQKPYFSQSLPSFFSYLKFDLYQAEPTDEGELMILADDKGNSTLSAEHQNNYFSHIADNTQYIIHPDEILADNFVLAVKCNKSQNFDPLSKTGKSLIDKLLLYLKTYKR